MPCGAVAFNDTIRLRPLWTVGKIFGSTESEIVLDPKPNALVPGDSVILPNNEKVGQNKAPEVELSFVHSLGWRLTGDIDTDQVHLAFEHATPLIVRRRSATALGLVIVGDVLSSPQAVYVAGGDGASDQGE